MPGQTVHEGIVAAEFLLEQVGQGTRVTWKMLGENDLVSKMFALFMDVEGMINSDFDEGLASLKRQVEEAAVATTE